MKPMIAHRLRSVSTQSRTRSCSIQGRPRRSPKGRPGLPARQTGGDRRSRALPARGGPELLCHQPQPVWGRSVPARPKAGIEKTRKGNCAPVCADPVDLQGRLGCGALGERALGRKQEGPSDSPSRAPPPASLSRALGSELEALHGCTQISDATDLSQAPAANFSNAGGSTLGVVPN